MQLHFSGERGKYHCDESELTCDQKREVLWKAKALRWNGHTLTLVTTSLPTKMQLHAKWRHNSSLIKKQNVTTTWLPILPDNQLPECWSFTFFSIGELYRDGLGVEQNYEKAFEMFSKAANKGQIHAQNNLGKLYMRGLGCQMVIDANPVNFVSFNTG